MMKPKKYPSKNLNRKKTLFFQMGLVISLVCILIIVEWRTEVQTNDNQETITYLLLEEDQMPEFRIPENEIEPIPEPKPDSDDFIIDEKEPETKEDSQETMEPISLSLPIDFDEIDRIEDEPIEEMPFELIEDVPIFPGCEQLENNAERKFCMSEQLQKFIQKEFDTGLASGLGLDGIHKIYTSFKININGEAEFINASRETAWTTCRSDFCVANYI